MNTKHIFAAAVAAALLSACGTSGGGGSGSGAVTAVTKASGSASVTLTGVEVTRQPGPAGIIQPAPDGAVYVVASYTIKNTGADALPFERWPQARLSDPAGHLLEPEMLASTALSAAANPSWAESISPNLSTQVKQAWKVDEKAFDRKTWTLRFKAEPKLTFGLQ